MRKIAFILTLFIIVSAMADAQIFDPRKTAKRKAEQRTNQKIDQTIDKALDKVFSGFGKKNGEKSSDDDSSDKEASNNSVQEEDASAVMGKLFGNLGLGGANPPAESYSFNSSYIMRMKSQGKKKDENYVMDMKYMFNDGGKVMGVRMMEGMIFDFEKSQMYNFMNMNGQKQYMGISVKEGAVGDYAAEQNEKITFTKTGKTKTIAGYPCDAYLSNDGENEYIVWMSRSAIPSIAPYYDAVNKMSATQKGKNKMAYNANPEMLKLVKEGRAMLGMEMEDKGTSMEMEMVKISPNDNYTFSTSGYSSMMDMGAIMKQAEEAEKN
jgi:hypothetical protein